MKPATRQKIQTDFRNCFLLETGLQFGDMVNVGQLMDMVGKYSGSQRNMSTVVSVAESCSKVSQKQEEFAECSITNLVAACKNDPYYSGNHDNKGNSARKLRQKRSGWGKKGSGGGSKWSDCEPCFKLTASDELQQVITTCKNTGQQDFNSKFQKCIKLDEQKKNKLYWIKLFKPVYKNSIFKPKKVGEDMTNCVYSKFGLGTTTDVNISGFKALVNTHLLGADEEKVGVLKAVDDCASATTVTSEEFTSCTIKVLKEQCYGGEPVGGKFSEIFEE